MEVQSLNVGDRFISNYSGADIQVSKYKLSKVGEEVGELQGGQRQISDSLAESLFSKASMEECKILALKSKAPQPRLGCENRLKVLYSQGPSVAAGVGKKNSRFIPTQAEKVLDAPDLIDDYYLNLMDWSGDNYLAVALGSAVYIWMAQSGEIMQLCERPNANITSVSWAQRSQYLAVGTEDSVVQLWDVNQCKLLRSMNGHRARVSALSWNGSLLSSSGRDSTIVNHDVRVQSHITSVLQGHTQEVCGLAWSYDGVQLASGGNDNIMNIWDASDLSHARHTITEHQAAVKALSWCPWSSNTLASGGGTADPSIRFWNTSSGSCLNCINTGAQVCAIQWSIHYKELASSHGWKNNICIWKYPTMTKLTELTGHSARVLHLAQSPDGTTLVSAAGDETLRFWKIWSLPSSPPSSDISHLTFHGNLSKIR